MILHSAILLMSSALAGPFSAKSMQGEMPLPTVERKLVLPKGWLEISLAGDQKVSSTYRDSDGMQVSRTGGTVWTYRQTWLRIEQGFSPRVTLYAHIPMVWARLDNDSGVSTQTYALGDVHTGIRMQPTLGTRHKIGANVDLKAPSGVEWPSDFIGGANNTSSFLTGTGVTNLGVEMYSRLRPLDVLALDSRLGYVHKFPAVVGYVLETGGFGNGWIGPGDELYAAGALICQVTPRLALHADLRGSNRRAHRIGVSGESPAQVEMETLEGTESRYRDGGGGIDLTVSEHLEVHVQAMGQLKGSDTRTFAHLGLEELSPQPGITSEVEVQVRW